MGQARCWAIAAAVVLLSIVALAPSAHAESKPYVGSSTFGGSHCSPVQNNVGGACFVFEVTVATFLDLVVEAEDAASPHLGLFVTQFTADGVAVDDAIGCDGVTMPLDPSTHHVDVVVLDAFWGPVHCPGQVIAPTHGTIDLTTTFS